MAKKKSYKKNSNLFRGESNPFNIKVNRKKHAILGSNVKGTKGLPAISKAVNFAKRKEILQKSKIASQKSNRYFDKRMVDTSVPLEDHVTARFVRERQKKVKKSIFNLNDDEELTHNGQPLQDLTSFDDNPIASDDEDNLGVSFVSKAHFGGFSSESNFESPKTHKEIMEELIAESKERKMEKKMEKEQYNNMQTEVDKQWKEIIFSNSMSKISIKNQSETKDAYDVTKNELKFLPKSGSISHTKTSVELAKEAEKKKIQLEKEKLSRMTDVKVISNSIPDNHLSADAILDEFEYLQPVGMEENNEVLPKDDDSDSDESVDVEIESSDDSDQIESDSQNSLSDKEEESDLQDDTCTTGIPLDINSFRNRVKDCDTEQLQCVLENILKKTVKSKSDKILKQLENFFGILLQHIFECNEKKFSNIELAGLFLPHLHSIATAVPLGTAEKFLSILDQEQEIFQECKKLKKQNVKNFPRVQTLLILKYAVLIYSSSDFQHPIVTPAITLMCDVLSAKFCLSYVNILSRLFISNLVLTCIKDSIRFVPEGIQFLNSVLSLAVPEISKKKNANLKQFNLILKDTFSSKNIPKLALFDSNKALSEEEKKIGIISAVISQLLQYSSLYNKLPSFIEIFSQTLNLCCKLNTDMYPSVLQKEIKDFIESVQKSVPLLQLSFQISKPKPLKMFEPSFESKFDQKDDVKKKQKLIKRVAQKIRKEEKSMLREIRRDVQVVASEKLKEKLASDAERKRKVKEIYGELAMQEGEFKKMMKKKT